MRGIKTNEPDAFTTQSTAVRGKDERVTEPGNTISELQTSQTTTMMRRESDTAKAALFALVTAVV